jgi:hypothetical protein
LLPLSAVLIRRCAWHRSYRGYPLAFGIASWRGVGISFTDGMCLGCSARLRREWSLPPIVGSPATFGSRFQLARVAAMAVMVVSLVLAERPLNDVRSVRAIAPPPQTVLVPPVPAEEESPPALVVTNVPRRPPVIRVVGVSLPSASPAAWTEMAQPPGASYLAVTVAHTAMPPVTSPVTRRPRPEMVFAALPHAGLTQQTP